jgi:hypothetical protein
MARPVRLLLLDLTGLSFCDARGLSAFVRIANHADAAGCGFGLIAPRPPVAKILRLSDLDSRMPVFATVDDARALLMAMAPLPRRLPFGHRRAFDGSQQSRPLTTSPCQDDRFDCPAHRPHCRRSQPRARSDRISSKRVTARSRISARYLANPDFMTESGDR